MVAPVHVGDVLAEKFEVTRILGQGGMGVVVAARHRELDKLVALKFMLEEVATNEIAIDRFLREARAAARLQNEHIGRVLDVGRLDNGVPYIVMEFLDGRDLSDVAAAAGGALPVQDVCEYLLQSCDAMAEAHAAGIVHRDLKPQNLFLTMRPDGRPLIKVLDFGISKVQSSAGPTGTHQTMGTPAYMSPEQMRSAKSCDGRADIWSLGVILYQLLSGKLPFVGDTFAETMVMALTEEPVSLADLRPGLPAALVGAVEKCLRKDRDERFGNVAELAHALTPFAPERARAAMSLIERVMSASTPAPTPITDTPAPSARPLGPTVQTTLGGAASSISFDDRPRPSSPVKWIAMSVVAVAAAVMVTVLAMRGDDHSGTATLRPSSAAGLASPQPPPPTTGDSRPVAVKPVDPATTTDSSRNDSTQADAKPADAKPAASDAKPIATKPVHKGARTRPSSAIARTSSPVPTPSAAATTANAAAQTASTAAPATQSSSAPAQTPSTASAGSPKIYRPVGDDKKPLKPVGETP